MRLEDMNEHEEARLERKRRAPYNNMGLGELIREMHRVHAADFKVLRAENDVPKESRENYLKYQTLVEMVNEKGCESRGRDPADYNLGGPHRF